MQLGRPCATEPVVCRSLVHIQLKATSASHFNMWKMFASPGIAGRRRSCALRGGAECRDICIPVRRCDLQSVWIGWGRQWPRLPVLVTPSAFAVILEQRLVKAERAETCNAPPLSLWHDVLVARHTKNDPVCLLESNESCLNNTCASSDICCEDALSHYRWPKRCGRC
jgi:hypothetical protein